MHAGMRPLVRVWSAYPLTRCLEVGMTPPLDKLCTSDDRITVKLMNVVEIHAPTNALDESHQPLIHFDCLPFPPFTTPLPPLPLLICRRRERRKTQRLVIVFLLFVVFDGLLV